MMKQHVILVMLTALKATTLNAYATSTAIEHEPIANADNFDIVGLRLSMPPHEVHQTLKRRAGLRITESKGALIIQLPTAAQKKVPGSDYVRVITALENSRYPESIAVTFTPFAGQEQSISIERKQTFGPNQQPTIDSAINALLSKYGPVSYKRKPDPMSIELFWRFDKNGVLHDIKQVEIKKAMSDACGSPSSVIFEYGFDKVSDRDTIQNLLNKYEKCGETQVRAVISTNPSANMVNTLQVYLDSWTKAVSAKRAIWAEMARHERNQQNRDIRDANQRKPEL